MPENNTNQQKKLSPRQKRERAALKKIDALTAMLIIAIFAIGFLYMLFLKRETVSYEENRNLAKFPKFSLSSYFSGEFTEGVADYYDDTVHNRSKIKKYISSKLLPLKGRQYGDDGLVIYGTGVGDNKDSSDSAEKPVVTQPASQPADSQQGGTTVTTVSAEPAATTTALPDNNNPAAQGEIANNIVVVNHRGLMLFGGNVANGMEYASYVSAYKEQLGDSVNVYSMLCPTAVSYYMPENYLNLTASEKESIDEINTGLNGVTPINVFDALLRHKSEAIYSRTDHHWQPLGAYYAAEEFAKTAGVPFADLSEYETKTVSGYVGTLYGYTQSADLINNPEDFIYYEPKTQTTTTRYSTSFTDPYTDNLLLDPANMSNSSYYLVFGGDEQITHVATSTKNGRNLVIFKDSYGNALMPMLTSSFENIYLCDIRYFDINAINFIKDVNATDLLFATTVFSAESDNRNGIYNNMYK